MLLQLDGPTVRRNVNCDFLSAALCSTSAALSPSWSSRQCRVNCQFDLASCIELGAPDASRLAANAVTYTHQMIVKETANFFDLVAVSVKGCWVVWEGGGRGLRSDAIILHLIYVCV